MLGVYGIIVSGADKWGCAVSPEVSHRLGFLFRGD